MRVWSRLFKRYPLYIAVLTALYILQDDQQITDVSCFGRAFIKVHIQLLS